MFDFDTPRAAARTTQPVEDSVFMRVFGSLSAKIVRRFPIFVQIGQLASDCALVGLLMCATSGRSTDFTLKQAQFPINT
jgi:hypothetical protein